MALARDVREHAAVARRRPETRVSLYRRAQHGRALGESRPVVILVGESTRQHQRYFIHLNERGLGKSQMSFGGRVKTAG